MTTRESVFQSELVLLRFSLLPLTGYTGLLKAVGDVVQRVRGHSVSNLSTTDAPKKNTVFRKSLELAPLAKILISPLQITMTFPPVQISPS